MDTKTPGKQVPVTAAAIAIALISGCGVMNLEAASVPNPMPPEQSKAQVVDAAREIVHALNVHVVEAFFWHSSCNDQGEAPFRGEMRIGYPLAPSFEASDAEVARMTQHLQSLGWTGDPNFHSHGTVLKRNNVVVVFGPQAVDIPTRSIELFGECRDVTTAEKYGGPVEDVNLT